MHYVPPIGNFLNIYLNVQFFFNHFLKMFYEHEKLGESLN